MAKTAAIRDKWNTELGAALRTAQVAYNKIKFEQLDLAHYELHHERLRMIKDVEVARTAAQQHNAGIQDAARGLTQMVGQVERLKKHDLDLGKDVQRATALFNDLTRRADGQADLPLTAKRAAVLAEVDEFEDQVDAVATWWG